MADPTASATTPLFEQNTEELAKRLESEGSAYALALAKEARELLGAFRGWRDQRPLQEDRVATIKRLFDLTHRAMDYLSRPR